jgi:hypothetical protein
MLQYTTVLQQCFSPNLDTPKLGTKHGLASSFLFACWVSEVMLTTLWWDLILFLAPPNGCV